MKIAEGGHNQAARELDYLVVGTASGFDILKGTSVEYFAPADSYRLGIGKI
jgi:hypothetical protein